MFVSGIQVGFGKGGTSSSSRESRPVQASTYEQQRSLADKRGDDPGPSRLVGPRCCNADK